MNRLSFFALRAATNVVRCDESKVYTQSFGDSDVIEISVVKRNTSILIHTQTSYEGYVYDNIGQYLGYLSNLSPEVVNFGNNLGSIFIQKASGTDSISFSSIIYNDFPSTANCTQYITTNKVDKEITIGNSIDNTIAVMKNNVICLWVTSPNLESLTISPEKYEKNQMDKQALFIIKSNDAIVTTTTISFTQISSPQTYIEYYSSYFPIQSIFIRNGEIIREITSSISETFSVTTANRVIFSLQKSMIIHFHEIDMDILVYNETGSQVAKITNENPTFETGYKSNYKIIITNIKLSSIKYTAFVLDGQCELVIVNSKLQEINQAVNTNSICIFYPTMSAIKMQSMNDAKYTIYQPNVETQISQNSVALENVKSCLILVTNIDKQIHFVMATEGTNSDKIQFYCQFYPSFSYTLPKSGNNQIISKNSVITIDKFYYAAIELNLGETIKLEITKPNYTVFFHDHTSSIHYAVAENNSRIQFEQFIDFGNSTGSVFFSLPYAPKTGIIVVSAAECDTPYKLITNEPKRFTIRNPSVSPEGNITGLYGTTFSYWFISDHPQTIDITCTSTFGEDLGGVFTDTNTSFDSFYVHDVHKTVTCRSMFLYLVFDEKYMADNYTVAFANDSKYPANPLTSLYNNADYSMQTKPVQYIQNQIVFNIANTWNLAIYTNGLKSVFTIPGQKSAIVIHDDEFHGQAFTPDHELIGNISYKDDQYGAYFPSGGIIEFEPASANTILHISSMITELMNTQCNRFGISNIPYSTFEITAKQSDSSNFTVKSGSNEIVSCYWFSYPEPTPTDYMSALYIRDSIGAYTENSQIINSSSSYFAQQFRNIFFALQTADNSYFEYFKVKHSLNSTKYNAKLAATFVHTSTPFIIKSIKADPQAGITKSKTPGILGMIIFLCVAFVIALVAFIIIQVKLMFSSQNPNEDHTPSDGDFPREIAIEEDRAVEMNSEDELNLAIQRSLQDSLHVNDMDDVVGPQAPPPSSIVQENYDAHHNQNPYSLENMNDQEHSKEHRSNPFETLEY